MTTTRETAETLWQNWFALWNGDLSRAVDLLAPDITVHAALIGTEEAAVQGADGVVGWISQLQAMLGRPAFTVEVGPIIDADMIVGRWRLDSHYEGGIPGATAAPGTPISFTGTDILRIADDRLAEYWLHSDMHVMTAQLGIAG